MHVIWTVSEARSILRKLREEQVRDGDTVVQLWERVLMEQSDKLGDECTYVVSSNLIDLFLRVFFY